MAVSLGKILWIGKFELVLSVILFQAVVPVVSACID